MFLFCSTLFALVRNEQLTAMETTMQHDVPLRAAARAIYDACYPTEDWAPTRFDEAERYGTIHYRQAVEAARQARGMLAFSGEQLPLAI